MISTRTDTIHWLEKQLRDLEAWRRELLIEGRGDGRRLEQIDLHRDWLENQLLDLTNSRA